ncbi:uncharacterized protein N7496_010577 [Penicillium cataractarum]|uniref:Uncharacterized protein n=1 Tax=Penicillium cataractarum TaxID=2100454 RepID=A0A9W9RTT0_9EURO|nr:uncharacterized protein N7496_010577 [Penicillium cataractarum]KAJ5364864.1 hypothetical protein N7496_010577 [Penicillium cataractarum]
MTRLPASPEAAPRPPSRYTISVGHSATRLPEAEEDPHLEEARAAMREAGNRELARGREGPDQLVRMIAITAVEGINQAARLSSPEVQSALDRAATDLPGFADLSFQQCLNLMILLAQIIKDKEAEADSH